MRWRPFEKPIANLEIGDLERLREEKVEEQLFLEYKSEWSPHQLAKSIAAFANTEGGTLVVGMTTTGRVPDQLLGFDHQGDVGESLDHLIRDNIAPRPDYRFVVVDNVQARPCLVVEVPRGEDRPYLLTRTGQVTRRTQTGTEPASRDYLDTLFAEGRAGEHWARFVAEGELMRLSRQPEAHVWTIPVVDGGLSVAPRLFTADAWEQLPRIAGGFSPVIGHQKTHASMDLSDTHLRVRVPGFTEPEAFHLMAATNGMVETTWIEKDGDAYILDLMIDQALLMHRSLTVDRFAFTGRLLLAFANFWSVPLGGGASRPGSVSMIYPEYVLADELTNPTLAATLKRYVARSRGTWDPEP